MYLAYSSPSSRSASAASCPSSMPF
jgi:hypothetical protein